MQFPRSKHEITKSLWSTTMEEIAEKKIKNKKKKKK